MLPVNGLAAHSSLGKEHSLQAFGNSESDYALYQLTCLAAAFFFLRPRLLYGRP